MPLNPRLLVTLPCPSRRQLLGEWALPSNSCRASKRPLCPLPYLLISSLQSRLLCSFRDCCASLFSTLYHSRAAAGSRVPLGLLSNCPPTVCSPLAVDFPLRYKPRAVAVVSEGYYHYQVGIFVLLCGLFRFSVIRHLSLHCAHLEASYPNSTLVSVTSLQIRPPKRPFVQQFCIGSRLSRQSISTVQGFQGVKQASLFAGADCKRLLCQLLSRPATTPITRLRLSRR